MLCEWEIYRVTTDNGDKIYAVTDGFVVYDVESIPSEVESSKWCYSPENGFYKNPRYTEPEGAKSAIAKLLADGKITEEDYNSVMSLI